MIMSNFFIVKMILVVIDVYFYGAKVFVKYAIMVHRRNKAKKMRSFHRK